MYSNKIPFGIFYIYLKVFYNISIMDGSTMITAYRQLTAFTTDGSDEEILAIINRKYRKLLEERQWEFLRKRATGIIDGGNLISLSTITDYNEIMANMRAQDNYYEPNLKTVILNTFTPIQVVSMGSSNDPDIGDICYEDKVNNTIVFKINHIGATYSFDYKYNPADITSSTTSVLPKGLEMIIVYDALLDEDTIQKIDQSRSFYQQNKTERDALHKMLTKRFSRAYFS